MCLILLLFMNQMIRGFTLSRFNDSERRSKSRRWNFEVDAILLRAHREEATVMDARQVGSCIEERRCMMDSLVEAAKLNSADIQCARRLQEVDLVEKWEENSNGSRQQRRR